MYALLLTLSLALAAPETTYNISDGGVTLTLPRAFTMSNWSNLDAEAKAEDGPMLFKLWLTTFQIEPTEASAKAWAQTYVGMLESEGLSNVKLDTVEVNPVGGRPTARVRLTFTANGTPGVAYFMATTVAGQVVHGRMIAAGRKEKQAVGALGEIFETMKIDRPPHQAVREVSTEAGFAATLPEGWRVPFAEEMYEVTALTAALGKDEIKPEECWVGIRPPATGKADVMLACSGGYYLGPVDEHSFEGEEAAIHEHFFAKLKEPIPAAEQATIGDRLGFYFRPGTGARPVRMAVAPYGAARIMVAWGLGSQLDDAGLDEAMKATLASVTFTGPDGGKPQIGVDKRVSYYLAYRPTHPFVLGPALLVVAGIAALVLRKKKNPEQ